MLPAPWGNTPQPLREASILFISLHLSLDKISFASPLVPLYFTSAAAMASLEPGSSANFQILQRQELNMVVIINLEKSSRYGFSIPVLLKSTRKYEE